MRAGDTHQRWHPHEDEAYLRAAIARVNGGDMDELRETIVSSIDAAYEADYNIASVTSEWQYNAADRILDAVAKALTSDDVVRELGMSVAYDTLQIVENRAPFSLGSEVYTENGKRYITTALIAAGIQKGEDDR